MGWFWRMTLGVVVAAALLTVPARAQDLDAGKSPAQLFNDVCSACHKNARELKGRKRELPPRPLHDRL